MFVCFYALFHHTITPSGILSACALINHTSSLHTHKVSLVGVCIHYCHDLTLGHFSYILRADYFQYKYDHPSSVAHSDKFLKPNMSNSHGSSNILHCSRNIIRKCNKAFSTQDNGSRALDIHQMSSSCVS